MDGGNCEFQKECHTLCRLTQRLNDHKKKYSTMAEYITPKRRLRSAINGSKARCRHDLVHEVNADFWGSVKTSNTKNRRSGGNSVHLMSNRLLPEHSDAVQMAPRIVHFVS